MKSRRSLFGTASVALVVATLALASAAPAAAPAGTDLWGGPAARGTGTNATFDTTITVSSLGAANGSVDYIVGGAVVATLTFSLPGRGVASLATPAALDGHGRVPLPRPVRRLRHGVVRDVQRHAERPLLDVLRGLPGLRLPDGRRRGLGRRGRRLRVHGPGPRPHERRRPVQPARRRRAATSSGPSSTAARSSARPRSTPRPAAPAQQAARDARSGGRREVEARASARASPRARRRRTPSRTTTSRATASGIPLSVVRSAFSTAPMINSFTITPTSGLLAAHGPRDLGHDGRRPRERHGRVGRPPGERLDEHHGRRDRRRDPHGRRRLGRDRHPAQARHREPAHRPAHAVAGLDRDGHRRASRRASSRSTSAPSRRRSTGTSPRARRSRSRATSSRTRPAA